MKMLNKIRFWWQDVGKNKFEKIKKTTSRQGWLGNFLAKLGLYEFLSHFGVALFFLLLLFGYSIYAGAFSHFNIVSGFQNILLEIHEMSIQLTKLVVLVAGINIAVKAAGGPELIGRRSGIQLLFFVIVFLGTLDWLTSSSGPLFK
jgi:hypothetical protein